MTYITKKKKQNQFAFIEGDKYIKLHKKGQTTLSYKINRKLELIDNDSIDTVFGSQEVTVGVDKQRHLISDDMYSLGKMRN
jgi:hypothetical protein